MTTPTNGQRAVEAFIEPTILVGFTQAQCMRGVQLLQPDVYYSDLTCFSGPTEYTPGLTVPDTTPDPGVRFIAGTENCATRNGDGTGGTGHGTATEIGFVSGTTATEMFAMTEPDNSGQANAFPGQCLAAWDAMAATGIPVLWSPSTTGFSIGEIGGQILSGRLTDSGNWLDVFLNLLQTGGHRMPDVICWDKYEASNLGVDKAAALNIEYTDAVIAKYTALYGITRYAIRETGIRVTYPASGGWAPLATQIAYMQRILPLYRMRLPTLKYVGWWAGYMDPIGPSGSTSLFNATGTALTDLGTFWRDFQRY